MDILPHRHSHMGLGILWKIIVNQQSTAASRNATWNYIMQRGIFRRNATEFLCAQSHLEMDQKTVETYPLVRRVHISACFWEKRTSDSTWQRWKRTSRLLPMMIIWGCISAHSLGDLHIYEGTIDAEAYVGILEKHMLPSWQQLFPGTPCPFQQDNARPHSAQLQQRGFVGKECVCLTGLPAVHICLLLKMYGENWTTATTDCWAARVLYTPRMGKNSTCKTANIDIFSFQMITKCN